MYKRQIEDRLWLGGQFVRFVLDEEAVPADYGYTDPNMPYLCDVWVSEDGFVYELSLIHI